MASKRETVDDLLGQLGGAGVVTARAMFGEFCVYLDSKPVGLVCDDRFYLKPTAAGRELVPDVAEGSPFPGAKPHLVIPREDWADAGAMARLLRTTADALPAPKPKKRKG